MIVLDFIGLKEEDEVVKTPKKDFYGHVVEGEFTESVVKGSPAVLVSLAGVKKGILTAGIGLAIAMLTSLWGSLFFSAMQGHNYYVQYPWGGKAIHTNTLGLTFKGFGTVTDIKDYFTHTDMVPIMFADKEVGEQSITYRVELPQDPETFEKFVIEYRSQDNFLRSLAPKVNEVVSNTAFMYTGQSYASGEAPSYNQGVRDQLKNGAYVLETKKVSGTNRSKAGDSLKVLPGQTGPVLKSVPKRKSGKIIRDILSFTESGVKLSDISLPKVDFSDAFDKRMDTQRKRSADFQNSILERKTIIEQTKLAEAQGQKDKTVEKMKQEKAAVSKITAARTKLLQDSIILAQSKVREEIAIVDARTLKVEKEAEAYAVRKMVSAGISPEVRLKMQLDAEVAKAQALSKLKLPTTYIGGGAGGKSGDPMQLLILEAIKAKK
jgi:hypothetical protein